MKLKLILLATSIILLSCNSQSGKTNAQDKSGETVNYETYCNNRFDYCVDYPDHLIPQGEAGNGDGQKFISEDGENLFLVYIDFKMDLETGDSPTIEQAFEEDMQGKTITDKQLHDNYYVISGNLPDGKLFTQYTISDMGSFFTMRFEFAENDAKLFDKIIKHVTESFNVGVREGQGGGSLEDMFPTFLSEFLNDCWWNKNFNTLLRDGDKTLAKYIDPKMDVRRYYAPGTVTHLATRSQKFGFTEYDDFTTKPDAEGEYSMKIMPEEMNYCELRDTRTIYYQTVPSVPDELVNSETFEFAPVKTPYPDAPIMCVYLVIQEDKSPIAVYFIETPNGWKLAFVDDTLCSA